jgi:hypothetical protein
MPKMSLRERWRHTSIANQLMVVSTGIMAFATVFLVIAGILQYLAAREQLQAVREQSGIIQKQLDAFKESSSQTTNQANDLIIATRDTANASQSVAEQNVELVRHAGEQAQASLTQADAARRAVAAAQRSAAATEQGVRRATQSAQMEVRPILSIKYISLEEAVSSGANPVIARVGIENSGRTPAVKTKVYFTSAFSNGPEPPTFPPPDGEPDEVVISPNMTVIIHVPTAKLSDQEREYIDEHKPPLIVWGRIGYEDIFGHRYYTEVCFENLSADKTTFHGCPGNNTFK